MLRIMPAQGTTHVTLGQSVVPLYGPWKFTVGDSPIDPVTHALLWAQPALRRFPLGDDRSHTHRSSSIPLGGFSGYVTGWTSRGHPGYSGYAWYRIRVQVTAQPGEKLSPGRSLVCRRCLSTLQRWTLVGTFGKFTGSQPDHLLYPAHDVQPASARLPDSPVRVLAFRISMTPDTLVTQA